MKAKTTKDMTLRKLKKELRAIVAYINDGCFGPGDMKWEMLLIEEIGRREKAKSLKKKK